MIQLQSTSAEYQSDTTLLELAAQCLQNSWGKRPELYWLTQIYESKRRERALKKAEMDALLYEKINKKAPEKLHNVLPIRYWRTGHHIPINRKTALEFGNALELSEEEMHYFITVYLDKSIYYNEVGTSQIPSSNPCYEARLSRFFQLAQEYFMQKTSTKLDIYQNHLSSLRHEYYMDAFHCTCNADGYTEKYVFSQRYKMEFQRNLYLLGEIPRTTMIRHLIIFGQKQLSVDWLNEQLRFFGYSPLTPEHTLVGGEYLDRLLIDFLQMYENQRKILGQDSAWKWFQHQSSVLDRYFKEHQRNAFRFMYFKSLE